MLLAMSTTAPRREGVCEHHVAGAERMVGAACTCDSTDGKLLARVKDDVADRAIADAMASMFSSTVEVERGAAYALGRQDLSEIARDNSACGSETIRETVRRSYGTTGDAPKSATYELGALVVVKSGWLSRVVAVIGRNESTAKLMVQLATNEIEQVTDYDLIVRAGVAGVPYHLAIQTELYGIVGTSQVSEVVGQLNPAHLRAITKALDTNGNSLAEFPTGPRLVDDNDPRLSFKMSELSELSQLVCLPLAAWHS